jgi:hypothetical protein
MSAPVVHVFRGCRVEVWPERRFLQTVFPDGARVRAAPMDAQAVAAADHGYQEPWPYVHDHEILHTVVAEALGWPHSPTLWYVAHKADPQDRTDRPSLVASEETLVCALQAYLNGQDWTYQLGFLRLALGTIDLDDLAARALALLAGSRERTGAAA